MITPDFSGRRVLSQPAYEQSVDHVHGLQNYHVAEKLPGTSESKRHANTRQKGHILIEKHGHGKGSCGERSPRTKHRQYHKEFHDERLPSPAKHFELAQELHNVGKKMDSCYEELKSSYMREISRIGFENVNSGNVSLFGT